MIADYMRAVQYNYSLSVFKEESGVESRPLLTEDELMDVLKIDRETSFFQSYMKSKAHGGSDACVLMNLVSAISEAAAAKGKESFTQTIGGDRYQLEVRMKQLEDEYQSRLRNARLSPNAGIEERLALYRQEIEEQAAAEVARQVERVREMEVAAARLDEASKARRALEAERLELDRLHGERLAKLRQREEEMMDKLRRQQRDVENVAYEYRQRILREEERLRNHKTEIQQQQDSRQEQLKQLERSLELRERAVGAREAAAEKKIAEATEAAAQAAVEARQDVEREYMELKSSLAQQRMQIEMDRSRILELRSEATAEIAGARAKEERLRALETARAEAEARAAAHAADAEVCRLQAEKLAAELAQMRDELSRRLAQASDGADAMLQNAAGAMNMLNAEAAASRTAGQQIRDALAALKRAEDDAAASAAAVISLQQERAALHGALAAAGVEGDALRTQLGRVEALMDEAVAGRAEALSHLEEAQFRHFQMERELTELRQALGRAKEEAAALKMANTIRRPPSRGADSPGRRSITLSPTRRPAPGATTASISALSLGLALGGGPAGALGQSAHGGVGASGYHWHNHQSSGGASGHQHQSGPASQLEFPIAAAPPRDATLERMDRLRRQEDMLASQEDAYRKRMAGMQDWPVYELGSGPGSPDIRDRSAAILGHANAAVSGGSGAGSPTGAGGAGAGFGFYHGQQQQGGVPMHPPQPHGDMYQDPQAAQQGNAPPYMTYVMHSTPYGQQQQAQGMTPRAAAAAEAAARAEFMEARHQQEQQMMFEYAQQQHQHQQQQQQRELYMQHQQQANAEAEAQQRDQEELAYLRREQQEQRQQQQQQQQHEARDQQQQQAGQGRQGQQRPPQYLTSQHQHEDEHDQQAEFPIASHRGGAQHDSAADDETPDPHAAQRHNSGGGGSVPHPTPQDVPTPQHDSTPGQTHAAAPDRGSAHVSFSDPPATQVQYPGLRDMQAFGSVRSSIEPYSAAEPTAPTAVVTSAPAVAAPAGLVLTSNLGTPPAQAVEDEEEQEDEPPPPPPKPIIPGLVMVSGFTPRGSAAGAAAPSPAPAAPQLPPPPAVADLPPPPPQDVESVMQAKMRMLQEQRERALAAQVPPIRRLQSQKSVSSRASTSAGGTGPYFGAGRSTSGSPTPSSPGADATAMSSGGPPPREDSNSELIAREAQDTVAAELSTITTRRALLRPTSLEGGPSRTSSVNRRELKSGVSFVRSEASGFSTGIEAPGPGSEHLRGQSMRSMGLGMTLDDIPSSLGDADYQLPGLGDDDDGVEAPEELGGYGNFAAEFSAGSVF
ncbi:hypothetical protein CHLRE_17g703600v5 [Chlamydomonas reinhardtii]|uniref:Uncharacterized protein n=1 Tax=Chlamydomonas reinhardtii TaxID=3055 RepID=A0A2K3CP43_CHLRE|nr:uncharacterized protein CHLRE_17g703600v5 [Chlamydomonas reinhardtii]PNW70050.1 hypothetical protein CHLRE_17g703600v5 [Chlamydomonas reinhardtii]